MDPPFPEQRHGRVQSAIVAPKPTVVEETPSFCGCVDVPADESLEASSLFLLSGSNVVRLLVLRLVKSKLFETVILLLIVTNTVFLALEDPKANDTPQYQAVGEVVFLVSFSAEMVLKMVALGVLLHPGSYLRDPWNRLDFLIVLLMYLSFIPGFGNYTAFRALRVLRPLRSMNAIKGLKILVVGLMYSVSGLVNVAMLSCFIFAIFGILGVQLWMGMFRQQCLDVFDGTNSGMHCSPDAGGWGLTGNSCPVNFTCSDRGVNPHYGYMNFDDTQWAMLNVFQVMTFEGWPELLLITYRVFGVASFLFFFLLILIASYFVPNLALAVINDKYQEAQRRHVDQEMEDDALTREAQRLKDVAALNLRIDPKGEQSVQLDSKEFPAPSHNNASRSHLALPIAHTTMNVSVRSENSVITVMSGGNTPRDSPGLRSPTNLRSPTAPGLLLEGVIVDTSKPQPESAWHALRNALHLITQGTPLPDDDDDEVVEQKLTPFVGFVIVCIFVNVCVLAAQHHNQPQWLDDLSAITNYAFTAIFAVELIVVLVAIGFKRFFTDAFLLLDFVIVSLSIIELFLNGSGVVSVFRALRLLRVLKLLRNFPSLRGLVRVILSAVSDTLYLNLIMVLFLVIGALTGKQLFGTVDTGLRTEFGDFYSAFLTVFQIVTTDGWVDVMWATMDATSPAASLFFVGTVLMGTYVILNLFLSILITGFERHGSTGDVDDMTEGTDNGERIALQGAINRQIARRNKMSNSDASAQDLFRIGTSARQHFDSAMVPNPLLESTAASVCRRCHAVKADVLPPFPGEVGISPDALHEQHCFAAGIRVAKLRVLDTLDAHSRRMSDLCVAFTDSNRDHVVSQAKENGMLSNVDPISIRTWEDLMDELDEQRDVLELRVGEEQVGRSLLGYVTGGMPKLHTANAGHAFFCVAPTNPLRVAAYRLVRHPVFDALILAVICLSSITLVVDNPREDEGELQDVLEYSNLVFTVIFCIEMCLKIFALGFVGHDGAYLRSGWNWLDMFIVVVSIVSLAGSDQVASFRAFRTLRALRPLRAINRNRGLKMIVQTLIQSVKGIAHVALLSLLNYLIFGILAIQLFAGKLYSCTDSSVTALADCVGTFVGDDGLARTREWLSADRNFDNILRSILSLFQVSSGDDWGFIMYSGIDAQSTDEAPAKDAHPEMGLFFVGFYVIGNFFMLNLFVGVVIFNFNNVKDKLDGLSLLTEEQKQWVEAQHMMLNFRPDVYMTPGESTFSKWCHTVVSRPAFEIVIALMIFLNVIVIATEHYDQDDEWTYLQSWANVAFAVIFVGEAVLKIAANGRLYFRIGWNRFDFFLAAVGIIGTAVSLSSDESGYVDPSMLSLLRVLRIVRIMRVLRLFKQASQVRILVETLWFSLPSIGNISLFMLIIYFVFAVVGVQVFANVNGGRFLTDDYFNFHSFPSAMQLMFIFTTNERWSDSMYDCMNPDPSCTVACGDPVTSVLFHVIFVMISAFVISNLFIAIILDNFATTMRMDQSHLNLSVLHRYTEIWGMYDPDCTMLVPTSRLPKLLAELQPPLGVARRDSRVELLQRMTQYQILEHSGVVHFVEVLLPLASVASGVHLNDREIRRQQEHVRRTFPELVQLPTQRYNHMAVHVGHYLAQSYVAAALRGQRVRAQVRTEKARRRQKLAQYLAANPDAPASYHHRLRTMPGKRAEIIMSDEL
jgi:hypothetical protein